jgi:putative endonuclease
MRRLREIFSAWMAALFPPKTLGRRGEDAAARYLRRQGYRIIARGSRARLGEIDLVCLDRGTIVFVEVKTRTSIEAGHPVEAVTPRKQRHVTRTAVALLKRHRLLESPARFDVVGVTWPEGCRRPTIEHFPDAFEAAGRGEFYS